MDRDTIIQGRIVTSDDIQFIRQLISEHPDWHRTRLSQEICRYWNWTNAKGVLKDIAARSLLRKLHARRFIELPAQVRSANNGCRYQQPVPFEMAQRPVTDKLSELKPVRVLPVTTTQQENLFLGLMQAYHYLGYTGPVGENLRYLAWDRYDRPLGCLLFGAAAWRLACRDRYIGWSDSRRKQGLTSIANNQRFLILPGVRVQHLASHLLGQVCRRLSSDWQHHYGHPIFLLETFVDTDRFQGTCYRAANWIYIGVTTGRSRNERPGRSKVPIKAIWLYPLVPNFRTHLNTGESKS